MPVVVGVGDQTSRDQLMTSGGQLTDDDDALDGGVSLEVFPVVAAAAAAAPVLIASVGNDACDQSPGEVPGHGSGGEADGRPGSPGNYVSGLARSRSDVTSQRRFHRRRSAVRCLAGLAPVSGLSRNLFPVSTSVFSCTCFRSVSNLFSVSNSVHFRSLLAPVSGLSPNLLALSTSVFSCTCFRPVLNLFPVSTSVHFRSLLVPVSGLSPNLFPVTTSVRFRSFLASVFSP